jgi:hypothetical protein
MRLVNGSTSGVRTLPTYASPNMVSALDDRAYDMIHACPELDVCRGGCPMEMYISTAIEKADLGTVRSWTMPTNSASPTR